MGVLKCHEKVDGTGIEDTVCRPSKAEVLKTCDNTLFPSRQKRPAFLAAMLERWLGYDNGIPCSFGVFGHGVCEVRNFIVHNHLDLYILLVGPAAVLLLHEIIRR